MWGNGFTELLHGVTGWVKKWGNCFHLKKMGLRESEWINKRGSGSC